MMFFGLSMIWTMANSAVALQIPTSTNPRFHPKDGVFYCQEKTWFGHKVPPPGVPRRIYYKLSDGLIDGILATANGHVDQVKGGDFVAISTAIFSDEKKRQIKINFAFTPSAEPGRLDLSITDITTAVSSYPSFSISCMLTPSE